MIAIVILRSTRGTAGSDIWYTFLTDQSVGRSYHPRDYAWRPLKAESLLVIVIIPSHPWLQWYSYWWSSPYNGDYIPGALLTMSQYEPIKLGYCCASLLQYALSQQLSSKNDVDLRRLGIAGPFVDDSITGRGVVLGRAATKLRSIETHPLTGGSTYQKLPLCGRQYVHLDSWGSQFKDERFKLLTAWTGYGSSPLIVIPWWVPGFSPWGREELVGWSRKKWLAFEILLKNEVSYNLKEVAQSSQWTDWHRLWRVGDSFPITIIRSVMMHRMSWSPVGPHSMKRGWKSVKLLCLYQRV